jgi:hypothetical protein
VWVASEVERLTAARPSILSRAVLRARMWPRLHWTLRGRPSLMPARLRAQQAADAAAQSGRNRSAPERP